MKTLLQPKRAAISKIILFSLVMLTFSCKKEINSVDDTVTPGPGPGIVLPDLKTRITSSVSGFVTDQNNTAIEGADVMAGDVTTTTNGYGYFEVRNIQVVKEAARVMVSYPGYFKGIKTYRATEGKAAFFRIKLLQKSIAGTINAGSGGNVSLNNGLNISFTGNAIKDVVTGAAYNGNVHVAAAYIDPTSAELNSIMPGDLRGIGTNGAMKLLASFGMMAVELTGDAGELLQIANGKKSTITMPVPATVLTAAPSTLPLWYFDENTGLWKEEGTATKNGGNYIGDVSHFSFWNCDQPNDYLTFNCTILGPDNSPLRNASVKITEISGVRSSWGWTDSSGFVAGVIPADAQLKFELFGAAACANALFSKSFATTKENVSWPELILPSTLINFAHLNGTVTDCNSLPVTDGYIIMQCNNQYTQVCLSNTGSYDFSTLLCNSPETVNFIAADLGGGQQSDFLPQTISGGTSTIPAMVACGVSTDQYYHISINGDEYAYSVPADILTFYESPTSIYSYAGDGSSSGRVYFGSLIPNEISDIDMNFYSTGTTLNLTAYPLGGLLPVTLTQYDAPGGYVSGHFSGQLADELNISVLYNVSGSFRIRRN